MDVGEIWAYRKGSKGTFTAVRILALGANPRRPRTKVEFLDDAYEGVEERFPSGRLWCEWGEAEELAEAEQRWDALRSLGSCSFDEEFAGLSVLEEVAPHIASLGNRGELFIHDLPELCEMIDWDETEIIGSPGHLVEDGDHCVAWPTAEGILQRLARKNHLQVYAIARTLHNENTNHRLQYAEELHAESWRMTDTDIQSQVERVYGVSGDVSANIILRWLGEREAFEMQQIEALRSEHTKLRVLAQRALPYLRSLKRGTTSALAAEIDALLGEAEQEEQQ